MFLLGSFFISTFFFYWLDILNISKNIYYNYPRGIALKLQILYILSIFIYSIRTKFYQNLNKNVQQISKNKYIVTYMISGKIYKMIVSKVRGPSDILQIIDNNSNDITSVIEPFMGTHGNFVHGDILTPADFGEEEFIMNMSDGDTVKVARNEPLVKFTKFMKVFENS